MSLFNNKYVNAIRKTVKDFTPKPSRHVEKSPYEASKERAEAYKKRLARRRKTNSVQNDTRGSGYNEK